MIKFGPAGNSESFYAEGNKSTLDMPRWLNGRGLDVFEYSFGKGVGIGRSTAEAIGKEAKTYGVEITVHAPYYINLANPEQEKGENGFLYLLQSMQALRYFGGNRCVFHSGAQSKQLREIAVSLIFERLKKFLEIKKAEGFSDIIVCPETMGKLAQIGDLDEVLSFVNLDDSFYPCIDFGHLNARDGGILKTATDYETVILKMLDKIGSEKTKNMHVHFSKIMYTGKGEVKHLTFADDFYGPEFEPLAEILIKYGVTPYIICESAGTQAEDAKFMKDVYNEYLKRFD